jgi:Ran GTPase-activating protein (RanGAP) involved in mRNA processing and transport
LTYTRTLCHCRADELLRIQLNGNSKRLFNSRVQPMQVYALCEALADEHAITTLDLSYNALDDLAAQAVATLLKSNTGLKVVNLAGNHIGPVGAEHLAKAMSSPRCNVQVRAWYDKQQMWANKGSPSVAA